MRVAIASEGSDPSSAVSAVGGRAPYYLIFDGKELVEVIKNPFSVGGGGAGFAVAEMLAEKNVDVVVVGRAGPNMRRALEEAGISVVESSGSVQEALEAVLSEHGGR